MREDEEDIFTNDHAYQLEDSDDSSSLEGDSESDTEVESEEEGGGGSDSEEDEGLFMKEPERHKAVAIPMQKAACRGMVSFSALLSSKV